MIGTRICPLITCLFVWLAISATAAVAQRPNVVVLLSDDLGWKDIGCYDGPVKTPALDELASQGVRFTDFHSGAAVCSPSRATLLTGRTNLRTGVYSWIHDHNQNSHLLLREITLAEVLKSHGYSTVHLGKWHLGLPTQRKPNKPTPSQHGFDYWFATGNNAQPSHRNPANFIRNGEPVGKTEGFACHLVVDEAITWLDEKRDPDKPFFLNVWFHEPHAPIAAPDEIVSPYGKLTDPGAIYSGTIDNTDRAIARLLKKLKVVDSPENTIIIYSSDNGSYRADRVGNLRGTKGANYEGGIRVPGIFVWPGTIASGHVEHEPAGLVDVLPTLCGLIGIDKPAGVHLDGSDLSPLMVAFRSAKESQEHATFAERKATFTRHQPLFWHLPASGPSMAIRDGKYSLVAFRGYEFPKDHQAMTSLIKRIENILRANGTLEQELRGSTLQKQMFEGFKNKQADKLRGQYVMLNMFNESWIPAIKSGNHSRFALYDLSTDLEQQNDLSKELPEVFERLKKRMLEINASVMSDAPNWHLGADHVLAQSDDKKAMPIEARTKVHRLSNKLRSPFDAFVYVNRIPEKPEDSETAVGFAGRIFGRLANQEGRVLVKLPTGMSRDAYKGFKTFLRYEGVAKVGNCSACHSLPQFTDQKKHASGDGTEKITPSLRNAKLSNAELRDAILRKIDGKSKAVDDAYAKMKLSEADVSELVAFLSQLNDVTDEEFRELILNVTVLDTSNDVE